MYTDHEEPGHQGGDGPKKPPDVCDNPPLFTLPPISLNFPSPMELSKSPDMWIEKLCRQPNCKKPTPPASPTPDPPSNQAYFWESTPIVSPPVCMTNNEKLISRLRCEKPQWPKKPKPCEPEEEVKLEVPPPVPEPKPEVPLAAPCCPDQEWLDEVRRKVTQQGVQERKEYEQELAQLANYPNLSQQHLDELRETFTYFTRKPDSATEKPTLPAAKFVKALRILGQAVKDADIIALLKKAQIDPVSGSMTLETFTHIIESKYPKLVKGQLKLVQDVFSCLTSKHGHTKLPDIPASKFIVILRAIGLTPKDADIIALLKKANIDPKAGKLTMHSLLQIYESKYQKLTKDKLDDLREAYICLTTSSSTDSPVKISGLPASMLGKALRAIGQNPTEAEIRTMLKCARVDPEDGILSMEVFLKVVDCIMGPLKTECESLRDLIWALETFDTDDDDGWIDCRNFLRNLMMTGEPLKTEDVQKMFEPLCDKMDEFGRIPYMNIAERIARID